MLASLAGLSELGEMIPGGIASEDELRAARMLLHASVTVRYAADQPEGWAEDDGDPTFPVALDVPDGIQMIVLESAKRAFLNPQGYASEQMGDYSYTKSGAGRAAYLTADERDIAEAHRPLGSSNDTITLELDTSYRRAMRPRYSGYC